MIKVKSRLQYPAGASAVVPLGKALHATLLLSTQEQMYTCEGRFVCRVAMLHERLYTPQGVEMDIQMDICGLEMSNDQGRYFVKVFREEL